MTEHEDLTPELKRTLTQMATHQEPLPSGLEDRILTGLRHRKIIRGRAPAWRRWTLAASAAAALLLVGLFAGRTTVRQSETTFNYVLLLEVGPAFQRPTGTVETQHRVDEYRQWARQIHAQGTQISGTKLADGSISLGPPQTNSSTLAGLFTVQTDEETARRIASTCPHLRYGGTVIIRPIAKT